MPGPTQITEIDARLRLSALIRGVSRLAAGVRLDRKARGPVRVTPQVAPAELWRHLPGILDAAADLADAAEVPAITATEAEFLRNLSADIRGREPAAVAS